MCHSARAIDATFTDATMMGARSAPTAAADAT